jgi:serine/threonine protein kinase
MGSESPSPDDALEGLVGEVLANRYMVEHKLGEGAMGTVYRARHVKVGRPFAVKVLHPRLLVDRKVVQRFEREAELAGRLHHPNVIGVVDVGETHGLRYMVMDFAEGPDLAQLLGQAPIPAPRIINLVRQLLEGLYHAHEQGLIHRDFKPENVIIERDSHGAEVPRIVDFGIAILREGGESPDAPGRLTTNGLVLGTPHYMAPEQAVADPVDHRIDLFALGIVLYEMLCGKLPFDGSGVEVARANLLLDPPRIAERVPFLEIDPLLEALARRLMAKKRDARPPTAKAARELLDLIDRDRSAAAAALGVPLAPRPPMTTMPSRATTLDEGGDPRDLIDTPRQVPPPLAGPVAVAIPPSVGERYIQTEPVETVEPRPGGIRRGTIVGAAIAAAVVIVGIIVVVSGGGGGGKTEPDNRVVAVAPAPAPAPAPVVAPIAIAKQPAEPTPSEPAPEPEPQATPEPKPASSAKPAPRPQLVKPREKPAATIAKPPAEAIAKPPAEAIAKPPVEAIAKPPTGPLDNTALVARYKAVGGELKALQETKGIDAASDLQAQFRMIRISDAMSSAEKRADAAAQLSRIHAAIAKLR